MGSSQRRLPDGCTSRDPQPFSTVNALQQNLSVDEYLPSQDSATQPSQSLQFSRPNFSPAEEKAKTPTTECCEERLQRGGLCTTAMHRKDHEHCGKHDADMSVDDLIAMLKRDVL